MSDRPDDPASNDDPELRIAPVDDEYVSTPRPVRPVLLLPRRLTEPAANQTPIEPIEPVATDVPLEVAIEAPRETPAPVESATPRDSRSTSRLYFEAVIVTLVFWLFVQIFVAQPVSVPTGSMLNTILVGDHLVVNRVIYGTPEWLRPILPYRPIRRGDIIVFRHPVEPETLYVKRVIALPGETVEVYGTRVYVNSEELAESKIGASDPGQDRPLVPDGSPITVDGAEYTVYYSLIRDVGSELEIGSLVSAGGGSVGVGRPFTVPQGQYYCLGDNRDNSLDSRFWGTVPRENVIGRAVLVYWSFGTANDGTEGRRPRLGRIGTLLQ